MAGPLAAAAPSIISGVASIAGGLMGSSSASKDRALYRKQMRQSQAQFDAQMDTSVTRRVADAVKAGIHPLFALGGNVGASPTISMSGQAPRTGNHMGEAVANIGQMIAQNYGAQSKRDEAEASFLDAQTAKINQDLASQGRDSLGTNGVRTFPLPDSDPMGEAVYYQPEIPKSKATGIRAGTSPGTMEAVMPDGRKLNLYDPDLGLDEISQIDAAYQRAVHHGADAFEWIKKNIGSKIRSPHRIREIPKSKWKPKKRTYYNYTDRATYLKDKYLK